MHPPNNPHARTRARRLGGAMLITCAAWLAGCERPPPHVPPDARTPPAGDPMSASYRPPPQASTEILEVPETGINLGWGWNSVNGEPLPNVCVEFAEASEPAQARTMSMSEVSDNYDLMKSMGMSAEASVKAIGVEVRGKAKFAKDMHVSRYASNFVMNATVENGVRYTAPIPELTRDGTGAPETGGVPRGEIRLTPEALRLAQASDLGEFIHRCGHGYVSAVYSGAKLTAVITVNTSSQQEHQKVSAELSGSGWGARFEGAMNGENQSVVKKDALNVSVFQIGGRGDSIPRTATDVLAKLDTLSAVAFDAPKDFHMAVAPYESLANWPPKSIEVDNNEYAQVASLWGAYNALFSDLQQVLDAPERYLAPTIDGATGCTRLGALSTTLSETVTVVTPTPIKIGLGTITLAIPSVKTVTSTFTDHELIERMRQVQDDVQDALHRLRNFAQTCAADDRGCVFPEDRFRSPYAYRVQMPMEGPTEAQIASAEDVLQGQVAGPAKRRCLQDVDDPGCLNNAEIDDWRDKLGMQLVKYDTLDERNAVVERLEAMQLIGARASCDASRQREGPAFSVEPGYPALWFHPRITRCVNDADASPEQCRG